MAELWTEAEDGWEVASPREYDEEEELQTLIEHNPQLLPLSGSPRLTVLGREVYIANCSMDILAVESTGRPVVVEVKLVSNSEARRRIVAQLLEYGAVLRGLDVSGLEQGPRLSSVADLGHDTIYHAVDSEHPGFAPDEESFYSTMQAHLDRGDFRLVLVLDDAPLELQRIVDYLDAITVDTVTIDLVTVRMYAVDGVRMTLTDRVVTDPEQFTVPATTAPTTSSPVRTEGAEVFRNSIADVSGNDRALVDRLTDWAEGLAELQHVRLRSSVGTDHTTLSPRIAGRDAGLVTIFNARGRPKLQLNWTVIESCTPNLIEQIRDLADDHSAQRTSYAHDPSPELLEALAAAYREAERTV